jgi:hypothetical protein
MRTEGPFPLTAAAGSEGAPIPIRDYAYKTVEVVGLTSGSLDIQLRVAKSFFTVATFQTDGVQLIDHQGFEMRVDASKAEGATLAVNLVAANMRAD